jgi:hypothetical protein
MQFEDALSRDGNADIGCQNVASFHVFSFTLAK